ncbi:uncharacterized protein EDB93DRAFT_1107859 [Suillus bovinus]|uniref:uncharacterized protein n=1 Tax=Suillus bovinus TaxID=48563 RepID=UPI001B862B63|nr:uncharacterized protein EDB93DRAFT_1107859 [Suillus bovinus]KAG2132527.1 hypothetical protein EDB93DRAFT_1107859 [Suillus bovinus]
MNDMKIEDAEFDLDEGELHTRLDLNKEADEDEMKKYEYDGIKEIEESDEDKDEDGGHDGGAISEVDDAILEAKNREDDEDEADDYGELLYYGQPRVTIYQGRQIIPHGPMAEIVPIYMGGPSVVYSQLKEMG